MSETVNVYELIETFENMANRGTLLTGRNNITQENLLIQIIGTIVKVAMEDEQFVFEIQF